MGTKSEWDVKKETLATFISSNGFKFAQASVDGGLEAFEESDKSKIVSEILKHEQSGDIFYALDAVTANLKKKELAQDPIQQQVYALRNKMLQLASLIRECSDPDSIPELITNHTSFKNLSLEVQKTIRSNINSILNQDKKNTATVATVTTDEGMQEEVPQESPSNLMFSSKPTSKIIATQDLLSQIEKNEKNMVINKTELVQALNLLTPQAAQAWVDQYGQEKLNKVVDPKSHKRTDSSELVLELTDMITKRNSTEDNKTEINKNNRNLPGTY